MSTEKEKYHPEPYWSEVADRIAERGDKNVIAGDDEPYYRYKRAEFLEMLRSVDFNGKKVLEIGSGPGGNIADILKVYKPTEIHGADISDKMIALAKQNLAGQNVIFTKINGLNLPFEDNSFDIVYTATVLQHNTDEKMLFQIISEIARVSKGKVVIFERIENGIEGDELCLGRPVEYYKNAIEKHNFALKTTRFINIRASYFVCGAIRKVLNPSTRQEGESLNGFSIFLQNLTLPITKILDKIFKSGKDIAKLEFEKNK